MTSRTGRRWRGVRFRITLIAVGGVTVVLAVGGLLLLNVQRAQLLENLDATLIQRVDDLQSTRLDLSDVPLTLANLAGDDAVVQIVGPDGQILAASANAVEGPVIGPVDIDRQEIRTVDSLPVEDDQYRLLSRPVMLDTGPAIIHIATNTDDVRGVLGELRAALWVIVPTAAAVIGGLVWYLVGRTLRPVEAIRREVAAIEGTELHHRVSAPGTGDEIDRLAHTMNDMLERQERAVRTQQQFVADASHELRTPITRMRTELDTGVDAGGDDLAASLSDDVDHLGALVDDLLHLARSDSGAHTISHRAVDLDDIVLQEIEDLPLTRGLAVDASQLSAAHLNGDPNQLRRMVRNLIDNAARHAHSTITVELGETQDGTVCFVVSDDGDGIPAAHADDVFRRFVQLDVVRSRAHGGTGLGLAITRDIVDRHGGKIELDQDAPGGARFVVHLPG